MLFVKQILLGVFIGLAACAWLAFRQSRFQADFSSATVVTPVPTASSFPTPAPEVPVVAGQSSIGILIYGVKITVTEPISDLVYGEIKEGKNTWAGFTTRSLLAKYPDCQAGALGVLTRSTATPTPVPTSIKGTSSSPTPYPTKSPASKPFAKTVAGFTYSYRPSHATCANDRAGLDLLAAARTAVKNSALPTLSN